MAAYGDDYSESQGGNQRGGGPEGLNLDAEDLNATDYYEEPTSPGVAPEPYNRFRPTSAPALSPLLLGSPSPALPPALQAFFPPGEFVPPVQRTKAKGRRGSPTRSYGGSTNLSSRASP